MKVDNIRRKGKTVGILPIKIAVALMENNDKTATYVVGQNMVCFKEGNYDFIVFFKEVSEFTEKKDLLKKDGDNRNYENCSSRETLKRRFLLRRC